MKAGICVALFLLTLFEPGYARPVILEEAAILSRPDSSWRYFGRFGVAIDGDYALVSGERYVEDPATGTRHEGTAFLYRRSGNTWVYQGRLGPIAVIPVGRHPGLAMKDGVAMTITERWRIWERTGSTFALAPVAGIAPDALEGLDIEIDSGRILVLHGGCVNTDVLSKINGTWKIEQQLPIDPGSCDRSSISQDLQGPRAAVFNIAGPDGSLGRNAVAFRRADDGTGWSAYYAAVGGQTLLGPPLALLNPYLAISYLAIPSIRDRFGTLLSYENQPFQAVYINGGLMPADGYLQETTASTTGIERAGTMFAQRNHSFDRQAHVINLFALIDDRHHFDQVATLHSGQGTSLGQLFDHSNSRIIVNGWSEEGGDNVVRVFQLPASFETPPVQVHDFEMTSEGALWQRTAGSTFTIVDVGSTNVFRQASTAGNPAAFLPSSPTGNQAIQVEVTPRGISGANAWVGLMTRRQDDANYYYVTLRASGTVELKRMSAGAFTTLAAAPASFTVGRNYRLRLESIGRTHRVYVDDRLVLAAGDATHPEGSAGIMTNRVAADFDNVVVTPSPFTTIYKDDFSTQSPAWQFVPASPRWFANGGLFRPEGIGNHARTAAGAATEEQVVQVRVRPVSFNEPGNWVGVLMRWYDQRNHAYVSLHDRDVIALWRRTDGAIQQLTTARFTVTPGTWYTVRVESIGGRTRVYVDGRLVLQSNANLGPAVTNQVPSIGQAGVTTYRAMADFDDFLMYQP